MENHSTLPSGALSLTGYPLFVACQSGRLTGYPLAAEQIAELHHPSDLNSRYGLLLLLLKSIPAMPRLKNHPLILNLGCPRPLFADEYLHFLAANNLDIPHLILIWAGATPPAESILSVEHSLPEKPASGGIALIEAENAALAALRQELRREPDFDEFWDYLTTKDETGTVADFTDDRLDWIGHSGKSCSTAKSTIRNRLTAAKKRNPFMPS
jgi:hypothetical protein